MSKKKNKRTTNNYQSQANKFLWHINSKPGKTATEEWLDTNIKGRKIKQTVFANNCHFCKKPVFVSQMDGHPSAFAYFDSFGVQFETSVDSPSAYTIEYVAHVC